jgi:hypothetical protein
MRDRGQLQLPVPSNELDRREVGKLGHTDPHELLEAPAEIEPLLERGSRSREKARTPVPPSRRAMSLALQLPDPQ